MFVNAILRSQRGMVRLAGAAPSDHPWDDPNERQRTIERLQSKAFVTQALLERKVKKPYGLEKQMMAGVPGFDFPFDRPKLCDRMFALGEPAIVKFLGLRDSKTDPNTRFWVDRLVDLAPGAASVMHSPFWRLLDPQSLSFLEVTTCAFELGTEILKAGLTIRGWHVRLESSGRDPERDYFVHEEELPVCRVALARHLLALRQYELRGDLVGYQLELGECVRLAQASAQRDLAVLQPLLGEYIASCFGGIDVHIDDFYFAWKIEAAKRAWESRMPVFPQQGG